jgi:hypothetical protein
MRDRLEEIPLFLSGAARQKGQKTEKETRLKEYNLEEKKLAPKFLPLTRFARPAVFFRISGLMTK